MKSSLFFFGLVGALIIAISRYLYVSYVATLPYPIKFYILGYYFKLKYKRSGTRSIIWNQAAKSEPIEVRKRNAASSEKLPNIILIIADDLG